MLNNNFSKLVKLYHKYQAKQRNKYLLGFLALLLVAGALFWFIKYQTVTVPDTQDTTTSVQVTTPTQTQPDTNTSTAELPIKKTSVVTPKTENMPKHVTKRTHKKSQPADTFQLKISQQKNFYNLLLDYKNKPSYETAIKLAQFYTNEKDYSKAIKWAIEASKKDPAQAMSWILYAKAKKALGNIDVAKKALAIYLKHNSSQEAEELLNSL